MKKLKIVALLMAMACMAAHAALDDEKLIGTYALDCQNIAKGAVILTLVDARLVSGEKITAFTDLVDDSLDYFGKYDNGPSRTAISLGLEGALHLEVADAKKGKVQSLKTVGFNAALLPMGLAFNDGQNTFKKCPAR